MQHLVRELREIGIQPDILICRMDRPLPEEERRKIALFYNVEERAVIGCYDANSIYKIPEMLQLVCQPLRGGAKAAPRRGKRSKTFAPLFGAWGPSGDCARRCFGPLNLLLFLVG